jgi:RimJ/RimL family protein N-acetyltransferase
VTTIRPARAGDADFIARAIMLAQRGGVSAQPEFRGGGLMQALLGRALEAGQAAGYARASISFVIGNDVAERCYARAGFRVAEEKRDSGFEAINGSPGYRRFERAL